MRKQRIKLLVLAFFTTSFLRICITFAESSFDVCKGLPAIEGIISNRFRSSVGMRDVPVVLKNIKTGLTIELKTNEKGRYCFNNLEPEVEYELSASSSGFETEQVKGLVLHANQRKIVDFILFNRPRYDVSDRDFGERYLPIIKGVVLLNGRPLAGPRTDVKVEGIGARVDIFKPEVEDIKLKDISDDELKDRRKVQAVKTDIDGEFVIILFADEKELLSLDSIRIYADNEIYGSVVETVKVRLKIVLRRMEFSLEGGNVVTLKIKQ